MSSNAYKQRLKKRIVDLYGGACACCGIDNLAFLTIDHIDGKGAAHRKALQPNQSRPAGGDTMYRDILKREKDPNIRVLCWNCNIATRYAPECPHKSLTNVV